MPRATELDIGWGTAPTSRARRGLLKFNEIVRERSRNKQGRPHPKPPVSHFRFCPIATTGSRQSLCLAGLSVHRDLDLNGRADRTAVRSGWGVLVSDSFFPLTFWQNGRGRPNYTHARCSGTSCSGGTTGTRRAKFPSGDAWTLDAGGGSSRVLEPAYDNESAGTSRRSETGHGLPGVQHVTESLQSVEAQGPALSWMVGRATRTVTHCSASSFLSSWLPQQEVQTRYSSARLREASLRRVGCRRRRDKSSRRKRPAE